VSSNTKRIEQSPIYTIGDMMDECRTIIAGVKNGTITHQEARVAIAAMRLMLSGAQWSMQVREVMRKLHSGPSDKRVDSSEIPLLP